MTTYNGGRYIRRQLESLAGQRRRPDELIVCDDRSTDDTATIVGEFAREAPFPVRSTVNPENLGIRRNFEQVIGQASGEIIFLCDQDDVWHAEKLERFEHVFADDADAGLVFCDANVVDENLRPLGYTFWRRLDFTPARQRAVDAGRGFDELLRHPFVAGACMAFRAAYKPLLLPLDEQWLYDAWMTMLLAAVSGTRIIEQPLNDYRQHAAQAMGGKRRTVWQRYTDAKRAVDSAYFQRMAEQYESLRRRLVESATRFPPRAGVLEKIEEKIALCRSRAKLRSNALLRVPMTAGNLLTGRYHRLAHGWKTVALDLFV